MRVLGAIFLLATVGFAGCFSDSTDGAPLSAGDMEVGEEPAFADVGDNTTGGLGLAETNRTSGSSHIHDYWQGRQKVTLVETVLDNNLVLFPSGSPDANSGFFYTYYAFPNGTIVYEGTGKLEFTVSELEPTITGLRMRYLTPAATDWSDFVSVTPDVPIELAITPKMADMPHAVASGWAFEFYPDGTAKIDWGTFKFSVVAFKGKDVEKWPAHPDFYAGLKHRVVMDSAARTEMIGIADDILLNAESSWNKPEKLISMGTDRIVIFANITGASALPGLEPTGYFLEYKNATMQRVTFGERVSANENSTDMTHLVFAVKVDAAAHDSPYAEQSRWAFRILATFANAGGIGLCPGCFPYTVDYHLTVIAYPSPTVVETPAEE